MAVSLAQRPRRDGADGVAGIQLGDVVLHGDKGPEGGLTRISAFGMTHCKQILEIYRRLVAVRRRSSGLSYTFRY